MKIAQKRKPGLIAPQDCHFFVSNEVCWCTGTNLKETVQRAQADSATFCTGVNVYIVRLPEDAKYGISNYQPALPVSLVQYIGAEYWR